MSLSYCHVVLAGYLTRDPELKYTPKGTAIADVSLAVNHKWKSEDGLDHEEVSFFTCVAFGRTAEVMGEYLKKGKPVLIDGRLKQESWTDKNSGEKKYAVKIIINSFQFLGSASEDAGQRHQGTATRSTPTREKTTKVQGDSPPNDYTPPQEDDVPFTSVLKEIWKWLTFAT